jgi:hypothetical protein
MQTTLPALAASSRAVNATAARVADESMRTERMRTIALRIRETMPDRLDEFMKETRQGASQGNWDAVMASWEVDLEFAGSRPIEHRASSLSDALRRDLPTAESGRPMRVEEPVPARMTSVTSPVPAEPQTLPVPVSPPGGERIVPYRPSTEGLTVESSARQATPGIDFASFAEEMSGRSAREGSDPNRFKVYSRLLYAMAGERDRALAPIEGMNPAERRFWRSYVYAFDRYLDEENAKRPATRAAQTTVAIKESLDALAEQADLEMSDPIFCKAVHSFGNYEEFDRYEFKAGDGVVVYWEVKQFSSIDSVEGYRTRMKAEFEIIDSQGNRQHRFEQRFKDDVCKRRRTDYFNVVVFEWPRDLAPGDYSLRVTVTDLSSQKIAEKKGSFRIIR